MAQAEPNAVIAELHAAFDAIDAARAAFEGGHYSGRHVTKVQDAHAALGRMLSDDWGNNRAYQLLAEETKDVIRRYVWIASDQLDCIGALQRPGSKEVATETGVGRWHVVRTVTIGGVDYSNERICNNPAFGSAQLDEWEAYLRSSLPKIKRAA